jgi:Ca-activated chloride channel family protein
MTGTGWGTWVAGLLVVPLFVAAPTGAQAPSFRTLTALVTLNVTVVGPDARPVAGLTEEQFEVFEDGVRQEVQFFAPGDLPLDVAILLDTSGSMGSSLGLVQAAAVRFIQALGQDDRASVMRIAAGCASCTALPLTRTRSRAPSAIPGLQAAPRYPRRFIPACASLKLRDAYDTPRRQAMVVLSDGQDTASGFGFDELIDSVRRQSVPIYTIAPRPSRTIMAQREMIFGETTREQDFELRRLAAETGARAFFPVVLDELAGLYHDIANELAQQYSLGYESSNPTGAGGFRRISLRIAAPGVHWRTRAGYLAVANTDITVSDLR